MLRSLKQILGYRLLSEDDEFGKAKDFLFHEEEWNIRYLVADTGDWLPDRKVLIPPSELGQPNWDDKVLPVKMTRKQIEAAPPIDQAEPVSRRQEEQLHKHFGWQPYWSRGLQGAPFPSPTNPGYEPAGDNRADSPSPEVAQSGPPLRSVGELLGYQAGATDGDIGHVDDFIADDQLWILRYLVIDTGDWLPGRQVLLPAPWITDISWGEAKVAIDLTRDSIENSPEFDPGMPVNRQYEQVLYDYYGRPVYWS